MPEKPLSPSIRPSAPRSASRARRKVLASIAGLVALVAALSACTPDQMRAWFDAQGIDHSAMTEEEVQTYAAAATDWWAAATTTVPPTTTRAPVRCAIPDYICYRESRYNPWAVNPTGCSGRGCYGKYQFDPRTWDAVARSMGRWDLVGNYLPAEADQDAVASYLWAGGRGCSHWAAC